MTSENCGEDKLLGPVFNSETDHAAPAATHIDGYPLTVRSREGCKNGRPTPIDEFNVGAASIFIRVINSLSDLL